MSSTVAEERVKNTAASLFLADLPPETSVHRGYSETWLRRNLPPQSSDDYFVVFTDVERGIIDMDNLPGRLDYSVSLQILILKVTGLIHEQAASQFDSLLTVIASEIGVRRRISFRGATRTETPDRDKEADRSWSPRHLPGQAAQQWPSVALEVGYSQSTQKLHRDIAYWINYSNGQVKQAITIDIKNSGAITIASWAASYTPTTTVVTKSGRNSTPSADSRPPPIKAQEIKITRERGRPAIEGGDLVIPHSSMFGSIPEIEPRDFIFTAEMLLEDFAEFVWEAIDAAEVEKRGRRGV
ncbi:hypothetical protein PISL3812_01725 [Talaromyces islandicus]|uniref:Uncharacterized protein n=1 Tax=Talaromyces islandicus TaxID=28573 RepID=A0A0U1LPM3_TALIS|nr:hypothetical protein PISL3812_01725 [Talaromyces islandicus]